jgi:hypothetical protein
MTDEITLTKLAHQCSKVDADAVVKKGHHLHAEWAKLAAGTPNLSSAQRERAQEELAQRMNDFLAAASN